MKLQKLLAPAALIVFLFGGGFTGALAAPHEERYTHTPRQKAESVTRLRSTAKSGERVRVIVGLAEDYEPLGRLDSEQRTRSRERISRAQGRLVSRLTRGRFAERRRFRNLPFVVIEIDADQLDALSALPEVTSLEADMLDSPTLFSSNPVIGSPIAWSEGYDGSGQAVAVLDTGVDAAHPYFSSTGKVIAEACFSTNSESQGGYSSCPGGAESSTEPGSAAPCAAPTCDHGTHIAGIVAGNDLAGPRYGVARGAEIIAVQVYTDFEGSYCGAAGVCPLSYASDQVAALDHIYSLRHEYNIAAVNLSLGAGGYEENCDDVEVARKAAIDNLRSVGIPTITASGNDGYPDQLQAPACISSAVSVGATTDSDDLASFSNVSTHLSLLAPGSGITSAVPGGGVDTLSGTSMATPHVAGGWAILKQKYPAASVETVLDILLSTGLSLDDNRISGTVRDMRRIDLGAALGLDSGQGGVAVAGAYIPLLGCRLVDTRAIGSALEPSMEHYFIVGSERLGLGAQGGAASGCGVPGDAMAVQVSFTVLSHGVPGFLRAWPAGSSEPLATLLAWSGDLASGSFTLQLCDGTSCPADFVVKWYGDGPGVDLVVDVNGYFRN